MSAELTIRQLDDADHCANETRYAWHRGSIQPYSSLWITIARFALLNRPRAKVLLQDLRGTRAAHDSTVLRLDGDRTWPDHEFVDLRFLAHELREPLEAFRWSSVGDFPVGLQQLFAPTLAMCPACMAEAYHTVLFSLRGMVRCPVHRVPLLLECPNCGREMLNRLVTLGIHAPICRCGHACITEAQARRPPSNPDRDKALAGIVEWVEDKAKRYWTYMPGWHSKGLDFDALKQHFLLWSDEAHERYPPWLERSRGVLGRRDEQRRCDERSGHRFNSLARIPMRTATANRRKGHESSDADHRLRRMFKCIRRYVVKHVLGGRIKLLSSLDHLENLPDWPRLLRDDPLVLMALSFLLWSQSSYWGESEWDWLRRTVGYVERLVPRRWSRPVPKNEFMPAGPPANDWISDWLCASEFLDLWPSAAEVEAIVADAARLLTSFHCVRRDPLEWWGWLGAAGELRLGVYRRTPAWVVAPRRGKDERRWEDAQRVELKQVRLHQARALAGSAALERDGTGKWRAMDRLAVDAQVPAKITGLALGKGAGAHAVIALHQTPDGEAVWVLRCMELPIRQTAKDIASGISQLKSAVREYRRLLQSGAFRGERPAAPPP